MKELPIYFLVVSRGTVSVHWMQRMIALREELQDLGYATAIGFSLPGADIVRGRNEALRVAALQGDGIAIYVDDDIYPTTQDVISAVDMLISLECDVVTADYIQRNPARGGVLVTGEKLGIGDPSWIFSGFGFVAALTSTKWKHEAREFEGFYLADDYSAFYNMQREGLRVKALPERVEHRPI
jgi:hypothetical protein